MKSGIALLGSCIVMFSLSAVVEAADRAPADTAAASTPPISNSTVPTNSAAATTPDSTGMHATGKHAGHTTKHQSMQGRDTALAATATGTGDPAYRAALKECVAGPEGRRDSCIDDAIARFGQS